MAKLGGAGCGQLGKSPGISNTGEKTGVGTDPTTFPVKSHTWFWKNLFLINVSEHSGHLALELWQSRGVPALALTSAVWGP